jgi:hypothetical protein
MKTKLERIWQGMALLAACCGVSGAQAAVSVYGIASSSGELITTRIYDNIATTPIVSYSFKVFYDARLLRVAQATRNDAVWSLFDGVRPVAYQPPDASHRGEVWFVGGKLDARNPGAGVLGSSVLLGTVVFSRLESRTPDFNVTIGRPGEYANFVTSHGVSLDALPGEVTFASVTPTREDRDLDGLSDEWEVKFFEDPKFAFYSDDGDRDGINNLGEQALGSDPTDEKSNLHMEVLRQPRGVILQWTSFADRTYTIEGSDDLEKFRAVKSGIKATPPANTFDLPSEDSQAFYRILLETAP